MLKQLSLIFALIHTIVCHNNNNRDLIPTEAPTNLTLVEIKARQVVIEWDAINPETVRGTFRGYVVRTWNHAGSQAYAFPSDVTRANVEFFPFSKNFITVSVRNEKYIGPPSEAIHFDAPQIEPTPPQSLEIYPLSNQSVLLKWTKPVHANGILIGYKIYVNMLNNSTTNNGVDGDGDNEVSHEIYDPDKLQAKLTGMQEGIKYRIEIVSINCAGESKRKSSEIVLKSYTPSHPSVPRLIYKIDYKPLDVVGLCSNEIVETPPITTPTTTTTSTSLLGGIGNDYDYYDYVTLNETNKEEKINVKPMKNDHNSDHCLVDCMIIWLPDVRNVPGEYFYLKYRQRGSGGDFIKTEPEYSEDFMILNDFNACKNYEIILVAVDGEYSTESTTITTPTIIFN